MFVAEDIRDAHTQAGKQRIDWNGQDRGEFEHTAITPRVGKHPLERRDEEIGESVDETGEWRCGISVEQLEYDANSDRYFYRSEDKADDSRRTLNVPRLDRWRWRNWRKRGRLARGRRWLAYLRTTRHGRRGGARPRRGLPPIPIRPDWHRGRVGPLMIRRLFLMHHPLLSGSQLERPAHPASQRVPTPEDIIPVR